MPESDNRSVRLTLNFFVFLFSSSSSVLSRVDAPHLYVGAWALDCFYSHISTRTFEGMLIASVNSCVEIKSASSVA